MKIFPLTLIALVLLTACHSAQEGISDASQAEISMAEMMGITVEELRNQTPQEHMQMMQQMMRRQANPTDVQGFLPGTGVDVSTLPEVQSTQVLTVEDGDTIELNPTLVRKTINGKEFAMYGYNGQVPGPMIRTTQNAEFTVTVRNEIDMETTVHWHGLRLDNASDGVPKVTQEAIKPGESFIYTVSVPDEGMYWYHPHVREDIQQDMGLYGNMFVAPTDSSLYNAVNQEEILVLDDMFLDKDGLPIIYGTNGALQNGKDDVNYSLMGRFGNTMLVNGEPEYSLDVQKNAVVRFFITNVANTRTFRIGVPNAKMKLVGSDIGRYEREEWADFVTIAPAERAIVEVLFKESGTFTLLHSSPMKEISLASINVSSEAAAPSYIDAFNTLRSYTDVSEDIRQYEEYFSKPVDKELKLSIDMHGPMGAMDHSGMTHTEDGIEWEDIMPQMNEMMRSDELDWKFIDTQTGKENMDISWEFTQGDLVKVRIENDAHSAHPMQHPVHFHGQRFLVLSMDGKQTDNLAWKDTVLIPTGSTAEILIEMSNPGDWMFHCHIAEHLSNGMMGMFTVTAS